MDSEQCEEPLLLLFWHFPSDYEVGVLVVDLLLIGEFLLFAEKFKMLIFFCHETKCHFVLAERELIDWATTEAIKKIGGCVPLLHGNIAELGICDLVFLSKHSRLDCVQPRLDYEEVANPILLLQAPFLSSFYRLD